MNNLTNTPTEAFIEKAKQKHGELYDYSSSVYVTSTTKIKIICCRCGVEFEQTPNKHLQGRGCKVCNNKYRKSPETKGKSKYKIDTNTFIKRAKGRHGDKYDYSKVVFTGIHNNVTIKCNTCGQETEQRPSNHLRSKGCKICNNSTTTNKFIEEANKVHGSKYVYSKVHCVTSKDTVSIVCKDHGVFQQVAKSHLQGQGCPDCAVSGFNPMKPATLYYISVLNGTAYKIGITNGTISTRYTQEELSIIKIIKTWDYPIGKYARDAEKTILKEYSEYSYTGSKLLKSGHTEMFNTDILGLDTTD